MNAKHDLALSVRRWSTAVDKFTIGTATPDI